MTTDELTMGGGEEIPSEMVEYVVQVEVPGRDDDPLGVPFWDDVATVSVPARTKRRTILQAGLEQAKIELTPELRARCLDADNAYVWTAAPPSPPTLRLA